MVKKHNLHKKNHKTHKKHKKNTKKHKKTQKNTKKHKKTQKNIFSYNFSYKYYLKIESELLCMYNQYTRNHTPHK